MPFAFFVSSASDTEFALESIKRILELSTSEKIFLIPLTKIVREKTASLSDNPLIVVKSLENLTGFPDLESKTTLEPPLINTITEWISSAAISRAFVGVPSPSEEEKAFQIAESLKISYVLAYDFMFKAPPEHKLWKYMPLLGTQAQAEFSAPLNSAINDLADFVPEARRLHPIGHLSITRALSNKAPSAEEKIAIKAQLAIAADQELFFVSASTQVIDIDCAFLESLLEELKTAHYPHLQLRFGLHPGIQDLDAYLAAILSFCKRYPALNTQFKIVLPKAFEEKLKSALSAEDQLYILRAECNGPSLLKHADRVTQSVPGALTNEAALVGKPTYVYIGKPYLPRECFSDNPHHFFTAKARESSCTMTELGLSEDNTPMNFIAEWMQGVKT